MFHRDGASGDRDFNPKHIPMPATFINRERWSDQLDVRTPASMNRPENCGGIGTEFMSATDDILRRVPPQNIEAEQALIGSILAR